MKAYDFSTIDGWDRLGMAASFLCVAHCIAMPVLLPLTSVHGLGFIGNEDVHRVFLLVILSIAALAFVPGYRKHGRALIFALVAVGLTCLTVGAFATQDFIGERWEASFTVLGGGTLVAAHWLNRSLCKLCNACRTEGGCCDAEG